jgi:hypothetical protein
MPQLFAGVSATPPNTINQGPHYMTLMHIIVTLTKTRTSIAS